MEEFLILVLAVAVVYLVGRLLSRTQGQTDDQQTRDQELRDHIRRLEQRITLLERNAAPPSTPIAPIAPATVSPAVAAPEPPARPAATEPAFPNLRPYEAKPLYSAEQLIPDKKPESPPTQPIQPTLPVPEPIPPPPPARHISLEERLGRNWLNKLGVISLVIGLASLLGYKFGDLGPLGKDLVGLAVALILLLGGLFLERLPRYQLFARAGIGGGWALAFFLSFALYHVDAMQLLHSQAADLILMLLVAAGMVAHSLHYRSQVVTSLAFLLAFLTVSISHVTLFSLVAGALLAAGLVSVTFRYRWYELGLAGLVALYANHFLWLTRVLPGGAQPHQHFADFLPSAALLILYWLLFRLLFVFRVPLDRRQEIVSVLTAILNSAGLLLLLKFQSVHPEWAFSALMALGIAEGALAFVARPRWRTAFIVLFTIASALVLAAIPFGFSGSPWTLLWLLEAEILFIAGLAMPELVFRRLGALAWFLAALQLVLINLLPIFDHPVAAPHRLSVAFACFAAATLFWLNAELAGRRWPQLFTHPFDVATLLLTSYLAPALLALGLWLVVPTAWTSIAWLAAGLALASIARRLNSLDLASQSDLLAVTALIRLILINFALPSPLHTGTLTLRAITITLAAALLYAAAARRAPSHLLTSETVAPTYTTAAAALLAALAWYELTPTPVVIAWGVFGLILFELGTLRRHPYLRFQAYTLFAAGFARTLFVNLDIDAPRTAVSHRLYTVVPLIAAFLWIYERTRRALVDSELDLFCGMIAAWLGSPPPAPCSSSRSPTSGFRPPAPPLPCSCSTSPGRSAAPSSPHNPSLC